MQAVPRGAGKRSAQGSDAGLLEREALTSALRRTDNNRTPAARLLGVMYNARRPKKLSQTHALLRH